MTRPTVPMAVYAGYAGDERTRDALNGTHSFHRPFYSLLSGAFILIAGGMDLAAGLGWSTAIAVEVTLHLQCCWFIGTIVGALLTSLLIAHIRIRVLMLAASIILTIAGIVFTSSSNNYASIVAGRYLSGLAMGDALVAYIVHGSEMGCCKRRGLLLGLAQCYLSVGMAIRIIADSQWQLNWPLIQLHGILCLVCGVLAWACVYLIIESPIYYIRHSQESEAMASQLRLRNMTIADDATHFALDDNRNYVLENENRSLAECLVEGAWPAIKLLLYRGLLAFSFSLPLSEALRTSSYVALAVLPSWPAILFGLMRVIGTLAALYLLDAVGRKVVALASLCVMAALSIAIGGIYSGNVNAYPMAIACSLLLIHQIFAGLFAPSTAVYLGEAFPMRIKPHLIAICISIEYIIHIIVICSFQLSSHSIFVSLVTVGVIAFVSGCWFFILMPETRGLTLREAQDRFRRLYDLKPY